MRFEEPPIEGTLVLRYKRFLADIELASGEVIVAHCPNTGGLLGCKTPGSRVWLRDSRDPKRKLRHTWQAIEVDGTWVNVDTNLPNRVVAAALEARSIPQLAGFQNVKREVAYGENSRIDVLLTDEAGRRCYVEVKSTTLVEGDAGLFPDAVTARGKKHLFELMRMVGEGHRAVQLFLLNRSDVARFRPADDIDPAYGEALREAAAAGVEILALSAHVEPLSFELGRELAVELPRLVRAGVRKKA